MNNTLTERLRLHARIRKGKFHYRLPCRIPDEVDRFNQASYQVFSPTGEDGLIFHIFDKIAVIDGSFVEIGFNPHTALSLNLLVNHSFTGQFYDHDRNQVELCQQVYPHYGWRGVTVQQSNLAPDNINQTIEQNPDLLVLNTGERDAKYWQALNITPRLVIFTVQDATENGLKAITALAYNEGYQLVGVNTVSTLAFFVRNDLICPQAPTVSPGRALKYAQL